MATSGADAHLILVRISVPCHVGGMTQYIIDGGGRNYRVTWNDVTTRTNGQQDGFASQQQARAWAENHREKAASEARLRASGAGPV